MPGEVKDIRTTEITQQGAKRGTVLLHEEGTAQRDSGGVTVGMTGLGLYQGSAMSPPLVCNGDGQANSRSLCSKMALGSVVRVERRLKRDLRCGSMRWRAEECG